MKSLVVNIYIILLNLSILVNLTTTDELGESSCRYSGLYDPDNTQCHEDKVKLEKLPSPECTALVYDGIICTDDGPENYPTFNPKDGETFKSLAHFSSNLHIFYGYQNIQEWYNAVNSKKIFVEVAKAKLLCDGLGIKGLILSGIYYDHNLALNDGVPEDFNKKLITYVQTMKTEIPSTKFGLYIDAKSVIYYSNNTLDPYWLDFGTLNGVLDYYVVGFDHFNECTDQFLHGGVVPMNSPDPNVNTLNKLEAALRASNIPQKKLYLEYIINPTVSKADETNFMECEISYNEYCENNYKNTWCADNEKTFFEKGQFAKKYANGFIGRDIDLIDRDLKCECDEDKYITFNMVLNGYRGLEMKKCGKLGGN